MVAIGEVPCALQHSAMATQWAMHGQSPVHSASIPLSIAGYLNIAAAVLCFAFFLLFFCFAFISKQSTPLCCFGSFYASLLWAPGAGEASVAARRLAANASASVARAVESREVG